MRSSLNTIKTTPLLGITLLLFATLTAHSQNKCLEPGKLDQLKKQITSAEKPAENPTLQISLISAAAQGLDLFA